MHWDPSAEKEKKISVECGKYLNVNKPDIFWILQLQKIILQQLKIMLFPGSFKLKFLIK